MVFKMRSRKLNNLWLYLLLSAIALAMLFPLLWLFGTSLKSPTEDIFGFPPKLLPTQPTLQNFQQVWQTHPFGQYLLNSTMIAVLSVLSPS
jgi:putative chitobiose transport system permease protein